MAYRTLLAVCTPAGLLLFSGCAALGLLSGAGRMDASTGEPRSGLSVPLPGVLAGAGQSIFQIVGWGMAVVIGALALAFVARLLNGRNPAPAGPARSRERLPETAATPKNPPAEICAATAP